MCYCIGIALFPFVFYFFFAAVTAINANSPVFSNGYFASSPPSNAVDGNTSTIVYTYDSKDAFLVVQFDKPHDIKRISVHTYGSK